MKNYKTEQETFWAGTFGDEYIDRNKGQHILASNTALFSKILSRTDNVKSVIEFGANIGMNLVSIHQLLPDADLAGVEINENAAKQLRDLGYVKVFAQSVLDFSCNHTFDLTLSKGVLIHINPDHLSTIYNVLYKTSARYICLAEYYNPTPVEIPYRGHAEKLFKRDFAGEMLKQYHDLKLIDYGFVYHGDINYPQDDTTWFLLEKQR